MKCKSFAETLIEFRVNCKLNQTKTAQILGVRQGDISKYESGAHKPTKINRIIFEKKLSEYENKRRNRNV